MATSTEVARPSAAEIQETIPGSNHARLLTLLYRQGDRSRADLARAAGLTKATVSTLVAELLEAGLVRETRQRPVEGPGRPSVDLDLARTGWTVVAVDLSREHRFTAALYDLAGEVEARTSVPADGVVGAAAVKKVAALIDELLAQAKGPVLGIGISVPGVVDPDGVVVSSINLRWTKVALRERLEARTGLPVCVGNDANAAALAEREETRSRDDLMLVKVGVGVGAAIIANGKLVRGQEFSAGEIGHVTSAPGGPVCLCGRTGCLEASLSLPRLEAHVDAADSPGRLEVLSDAGNQLGLVLAPLVGALGLTSVVVTGLPDSIATEVLAATHASLEARLPPDISADLSLRPPELGDDVVLRGALVLVLSGVLGII